MTEFLSVIDTHDKVYKRIKKYHEKKDVDFNGVQFVPDLRKTV